MTDGDLLQLFHRLNNQLGIILANAELLETRLGSETERARAECVVTSVIDAIQTTQRIRQVVGVVGSVGSVGPATV